MTAQLAPAPVFRSWDNLGFPLAGGQLFTYAAGTSTPQATYVDSTQTTQNTNPVILNFRGEAFVWLNPLQSYKFVLQDVFGNLIWTEDNIPGAIGVGSNIIPTQTNTFTLGTPTISFANGYFGPNNAPVFDPVSGNIGYYARTAAEIAAVVTPTNYAYAPLDPWRYGADGAGGANDTTAFARVQLVLAQTTGTDQWRNGLAFPGYPRTAAENSASVVPINYYKFPSPWKDISRFVPDNLGINDYSVQLNAAFAAEKNIILPEGTYVFGAALGTPITLRPGQTITGGGRGSQALATTVIKVLSTTVQPFNTANISAGTGGLVLSNFCITGPGSGTSTTVALDFVSCYQASLEKMLIIGFLTGWNLRQGVSSNSSFLNSATDCIIAGNATNIAASLNSNRLTLRNVTFGAGGAASTTGLKVYDSLGLSIYGGDCEGCSLVAVDLDNTVAGVIGNHLISGVDFEANTATLGDIRIGNTGMVSTVEINASSFSPGGSNPYPINAQRCDGLAIAHSKMLAGYATGIINVGVSLTNLAIICSPSFFAGGSAVAGMVLSSTGAKAVGHGATAVTLVNGNSIVTAGKRAERFTAAGNITGLALNAGTSAGQQFTIINEVNFTLTMAAAGISLVANGVACVVPALSQKTFYWDTGTSFWYSN